MLEKFLDAFLSLFFLVTSMLVLLLISGFVYAYYNIVPSVNYKTYKEANDKCYVMYGRLLTTDDKYICYGAPVNGKPMVYFEMDKSYK
jgi:hypothetical protein